MNSNVGCVCLQPGPQGVGGPQHPQMPCGLGAAGRKGSLSAGWGGAERPATLWGLMGGSPSSPRPAWGTEDSGLRPPCLQPRTAAPWRPLGGEVPGSWREQGGWGHVGFRLLCWWDVSRGAGPSAPTRPTCWVQTRRDGHVGTQTRLLATWRHLTLLTLLVVASEACPLGRQREAARDLGGLSRSLGRPQTTENHQTSQGR